MSFWQALVLGSVQGLSEFLPISSSGHLVVLQRFFDLQGQLLFFDVILHLGTLVAVLVVFWQDILGIIKKPFSKLPVLLLVGTIPTALIGLGFKDTFDRLFTTGQTLGIEFLLTGTLLWLVEGTTHRGKKTIEQMTGFDALVIGTAQGLAILPAISRSGLTISGALFRHLNRTEAARFSFLLSAPAILGATIVEGAGALDSTTPLLGQLGLPALVTGFLAAVIFGYFAIRVMLGILARGNMRLFSYYVWLLGALILFDQLWSNRFFPPLF